MPDAIVETEPFDDTNPQNPLTTCTSRPNNTSFAKNIMVEGPGGFGISGPKVSTCSYEFRGLRGRFEHAKKVLKKNFRQPSLNSSLEQKKRGHSIISLERCREEMERQYAIAEGTDLQQRMNTLPNIERDASHKIFNLVTQTNTSVYLNTQEDEPVVANGPQNVY